MNGKDDTLYYHDGSLENGINDNSYRYAGASEQVNNFVCFGSTKTPCPTDNLYRIIGVFGENNHGVTGKQLVKLIKYDYATNALLGTDGDYNGLVRVYTDYYKGSLSKIDTYYWNYKADTSNYNNTWSTSLLNKTNLNTNFINNIGTIWANKIATTTWKVGGNTNENIRNAVPSIAYQNEVLNPAPGSTSTTGETTYTAKIGLMYASDYGFGAVLEAWTTTLYSYSDSVNEATIRSQNWMHMGYSEWTVSRSSDFSVSAFYAGHGGHVLGTSVDSGYGVRPSFFLESSITYVSGSGSMSDPIRIN